MFSLFRKLVRSKPASSSNFLCIYRVTQHFASTYPFTPNAVIGYFFCSCQFSTEIFEREFCEIDKRVLSKHDFCLLNIYELQGSLQSSNIVFVSCLLPSQTNNKKMMFLRVKSAHFNALKELFCERKSEPMKVDVFELVFLQKTTCF
jgi:hypothetical protein